MDNHAYLTYDIYIYTYVYIYVCMCIYNIVYIYIYICTYPIYPCLKVMRVSILFFVKTLRASSRGTQIEKTKNKGVLY